MANDKIFKRKPKERRHIRRKSGGKKENTRILIISEGTKTEVHYFRNLVEFEGIVGVVIKPATNGTAPSSVFSSACDMYQKEINKGETFDNVYCVFDRDEHACFDKTIDAIERKNPKGVFKAIKSYPCFEYWILLHFKDTDAPFDKCNRYSASSKAERAVLAEFPGYRKNGTTLYQELLGRLQCAVERSKRRLANVMKDGEKNPSSEVHNLVLELLSHKPK